MTIKASEIKSETIREAIREIEEKFGITGDKAEAIASHIVYTDEDWTDVEESETGEEKDICKIADELKEDHLYIAVCKDGDKIRVKRNCNDEIEKGITGVLTTWRFFEDEYPDLNIEEWGYQNISAYIIAFEKLR